MISSKEVDDIMVKYDIGIKESCEYRFSIEAKSKEEAIDKAFDELTSGREEEYDSNVYSRVMAINDISEQNLEWKLDHY